MSQPAAAELRRWSDEVARDPGAPAFLPLARALRRQGRRDAALRLCQRGVERNPGHLEARALLAALYAEAGEAERAAAEWNAIRRDVSASATLSASPRPRVPASGGAPASAEARDPARLFAPLLNEPPFLGALIVDRNGLVLAGTCRPGTDIEALGAGLGAAIDESARAAEYLALGAWEGALLEAERAVVRMMPLPGELAVLLAVRADAPAGWVLRLSERAAALARTFLGAES